MLVRRSVLEKVRYDEFLGNNSYRDETDFQLSARGNGFRLTACSEVYLMDLAAPGDAGGCHDMSPLQYHFLCCRNNWRVLARHRGVLKEIGATAPIQIMQAMFAADHLLNRLPRELLAPWRRRIMVQKLRPRT
jgi:hypothetical protein